MKKKKISYKLIFCYKFFIALHFVDGVLIPFFTDWGGISFSDIMILQSWFMLCIFLLEIPTGSIADYLGRKNTLILATIVNMIAIMLYSSTPIFLMFFFAEFFWAFAEALISGALEAFIYDTLKKDNVVEKSKRIYNKSETIRLIGYLVSAPVGSLIAWLFGLRIVMLSTLIPFGLGLIIAFKFKEPIIKDSIIKSKGYKKSYFRILKDGVKYFFKSRPLKILAVDYISIFTVAYLMIWLYQPVLIQINIPILFFGIISAISVFLQILILSKYRRLELLLKSKKRMIFLTALITSISCILAGLFLSIYFIQFIVPIIIISIVLTMGFGFSRTAVFINYMNKHIPTSERATVISTISMFQRLSIVILNPLIGLSVQYWSLNYTLIILGAIALFFTFISRVREKHLIG
jgi:MFS family permease